MTPDSAVDPLAPPPVHESRRQYKEAHGLAREAHAEMEEARGAIKETMSSWVDQLAPPGVLSRVIAEEAAGAEGVSAELVRRIIIHLLCRAALGDLDDPHEREGKPAHAPPPVEADDMRGRVLAVVPFDRAVSVADICRALGEDDSRLAQERRRQTVQALRQQQQIERVARGRYRRTGGNPE